MMKFTPLLLVALFVVACTPDLPPLPKTTQASATAGAASSAPAPSSAGSTATTPPAPTTTTTTGTSTSGSTTTATTGASSTATTPSGPQPGDNPRRIHQIRELEHGVVLVGGQKLDTWLMDDESKQQEGMMWLTEKDVKDDQGMLFVFASPQPQSFWMQNTLIPLDIIYMDAKGKVLNIVHGKPKDETPLPSTGSAQYVLELKGGMAAKFRIGPGTVLTIPSNAKYNGDAQPQQPGISLSPPGR
jgi:uncharacterized membrane protein (UPF0127 family)